MAVLEAKLLLIFPILLCIKSVLLQWKGIKESLKCCFMAFLIYWSLMWNSLSKRTSLTEKKTLLMFNKKQSALTERTLSIWLYICAVLTSSPCNHTDSMNTSPLTCSICLWQSKSVSPNDFRVCRQPGLPCLFPSTNCLQKSREVIDRALWKVGKIDKSTWIISWQCF